jgi:parallel beta-helix repeat protein
MTALRRGFQVGFGKRTVRRLCIVAAGFITAVPLMGAPASASSGTLYITSNTTLTEDHDGSIVIAADNVTLDCAGHTVSGPGELDAGILLDGRSGVTITDCQVRGFQIGFFLTSASGNTFEDNLASANQHEGVLVAGSSDNVFDGNTSKDNGSIGFFFEGAQGNVLRRNTAIANGISSESSGFFLGSSSNNLLEKNLSVGNGYIGFLLLGGNGNVLDSNEARANLDNGFHLHGSVNSTLSMNRSVGNFRRGFGFIEVSGLVLLGNEAVGNEGFFGYEVHVGSAMTWRGNSAIGNGGGFLLDSVNHSVFTGNIARNTDIDFDGFAIGPSSSGNEFRGNSSVRNGQDGFRIFEGSNDNVFEMNQANENRYDGFSIQSSNGNLLETNQAMLNGARGFSVLFGSSGNSLRRNLACRNSEVDAFDDHAGAGNVWEANIFCTSNI